MSTEYKIHVGDIGTIFNVETNVDISNATLLKLKLMHADNTTTKEWTGAVKGDDDSVFQYTTIVDDLDTAGKWTAQVYAEFGGGTTKWHGSPFDFHVYALKV